ncbi:MAG: hypothetical protein HY884_03530 [Deltaproteobacteria bacterium]|nr:hypothetical protein [Deltaproteobacteria bacterium]
MAGITKDFFAAYHSAMFELLAEDAIEYNAKLGILIASRWIKGLKHPPSNASEFKDSLGAFFNGQFKFADSAAMTFAADGTAAVQVEGCAICPGNEILKKSGKSGYCPICHMVKFAAYKTIKMNIELTEIVRPGPVGECRLRYKTA